MKSPLALTLLLLIAACDGRDLTAPVDNGNGDPADTQMRTFDVRYEVNSSSEQCTVDYRSPSGAVTSFTTSATLTLPWTLGFSVTVERDRGPFEAFVRSTCRDPFKHGKSNVFLLVDGIVQARDEATGYDVSAEVRKILWIDP